ncbi:hypothetical protein MOUN0_G06524 [Monosporozyma unispora]|nr:hypothetical protein C6P44_001767 [Kazachstania unispora]
MEIQHQQQQQLQDMGDQDMEDGSPSPGNTDLLAKRRRQNREAQRAYRERKANRIQVLERSMGILQDMVTSWEKKYNDLKLQYDEQNVELNCLKLQLRNGEDRSSIGSDSTVKDFERNTTGALLASSMASSLTGVTVNNNSLSTGPMNSINSDAYERIKRHMAVDSQQQHALDSVSINTTTTNTNGLSRTTSYPVPLFPTPGVSKPMSTHPNKDRSNSTTSDSNVSATNYNSLLFMLDSIANKSSTVNSPKTSNDNNTTLLPSLKDKGIDPTENEASSTSSTTRLQ